MPTRLSLAGANSSTGRAWQPEYLLVAAAKRLSRKRESNQIAGLCRIANWWCVTALPR